MESINFKYSGGKKTVSISTTAPNFSYRVIPSEYTDWFTYTIGITSLTISVSENASYIRRTSRLALMDDNGNSDYIDISQDGYNNLLIDISTYVVIPYTYYAGKKNYDLPIRVYGGDGNFITDDTISGKIEKVFDDSNLYNDYIFHIDKQTNGRFTFKHANRDEYIKYCNENGIPYDDSKLLKHVIVRNIPKEVMDGYTVFSYLGMEYINKIPPVITINPTTPTTINVDYNCYFTKDMELVEDSDFIIDAPNDWVKSIYDVADKKIYLKAINQNRLTDRRGTITVRNRYNPKQTYSATIIQKASKI
jgi:hypothetical protein